MANLLIRQVADRFHEPDRQEPQLTERAAATGGGVATATRTGTGRPPTRPVLLVVSWLRRRASRCVYGIYETVVKASSLFG